MSRSTATKSEKPTPRRKREARREGRMAKSQEVAVAFSLLGALIGFKVFAPHAAKVITEQARALFAMSGTGLSRTQLQSSVVAMFIAGVLPFLGIALLSGVASGVVQVGFTFAPKAAKPKLSNLSPKRGLQRLKPSVAGWELARSALKLGLLAAIMWGPLSDWVRQLITTRRLDVALAGTAAGAWGLLARATVLAILIAAADYSINRYRTNKELKMTKQEVKQESKDSEGDPIARALRRRRQAEISRNRMIMDVAGADVVVTNPTHYAVALRYRRPEPAPRVLAKGANALAARIRREAYRHGVPVIENRPLARALFRTTKVGRFIPGGLYEAAALVLARAYRRRRRPR